MQKHDGLLKPGLCLYIFSSSPALLFHKMKAILVWTIKTRNQLRKTTVVAWRPIFVSTGIAFLGYENEIGLENLGINKSRKNMTVWNQDWVVCLSAMFREKSVTWCVLKMRCPTTFLKQTFDGTQISKLQIVGLQIKIEEIRIYFLWLLFYSS